MGIVTCFWDPNVSEFLSRKNVEQESYFCFLEGII